MNKKTILITLFALIAMTGWAQKQVAWEKPTAFMGAYNSEFEITKVELKPTETVLHIIANYRPGSWIRFAKESFLLTPDGKKFDMKRKYRVVTNNYVTATSKIPEGSAQTLNVQTTDLIMQYLEKQKWVDYQGVRRLEYINK